MVGGPEMCTHPLHQYKLIYPLVLVYTLVFIFLTVGKSTLKYEAFEHQNVKNAGSIFYFLS